MLWYVRVACGMCRGRSSRLDCFFNWLLFGMRSNRRDAVVCAGYLWKVLFDHNSILMLPFREELTKAGTEGNRQRVGGRGEREVETEGNR